MSDHDQPVAANLLDRQFEADAPNQRWVGDTTEFVIGSSGKLYLAAVLDLFSRFIVGWAVSAVNDRHAGKGTASLHSGLDDVNEKTAVEMTSPWKPKNGFHRDLEILQRTQDSHIPTSRSSWVRWERRPNDEALNQRN